MTTRRDFLEQLALTGGMLGLSRVAAAQDAVAPAPAASNKKKVLILGGTSFIGPHVVEELVKRGHTVTLFNRGRTNPELFAELEKLQGDRDPDKGEGLKALEGRAFDWVVDTSGHYPRHVKATASMLGKHASQYVFVSSLSALRDHAKPGADETYPVATLADPTVETMGESFENFGGLKALCEKAAEEAMPGRATVVRPGLIVGPRDNVPRFTYWPVRVRRGGEVLAPGSPDDPVQYIDVRDLALFIVTVLEKKHFGIYHANGPNTPTSIGEVLYGCKAVTGGDARFTWVPADFLEAQGVQGWSHMPLWIPPVGDYAGFHRVSIARAIAAGLTSRPLADTVRDTLAWFDAWPKDKPFPWRGGIEPAQEEAVLHAWHTRDKEPARDAEPVAPGAPSTKG